MTFCSPPAAALLCRAVMPLTLTGVAARHTFGTTALPGCFRGPCALHNDSNKVFLAVVILDPTGCGMEDGDKNDIGF